VREGERENEDARERERENEDAREEESSFYYTAKQR
jgi:hypothetical protein